MGKPTIHSAPLHIAYQKHSLIGSLVIETRYILVVAHADGTTGDWKTHPSYLYKYLGVINSADYFSVGLA